MAYMRAVQMREIPLTTAQDQIQNLRKDKTGLSCWLMAGGAGWGGIHNSPTRSLLRFIDLLPQSVGNAGQNLSMRFKPEIERKKCQMGLERE